MDGGLGRAVGIIDLDISPGERKAAQFEGTLNNLQGDRGLEKVAGAFREVGLVGVATGGLITAGFGLAIRSAATFESQINAVQAVMNPAEWQQYSGAIEETALRIGRDFPLSATQAGAAIEELSKAGISAEDIVGGAAEGVALLSVATGTDLVTSANIASVALNQFGLAGSDMADVADIITNAANESTLSVEDLGYSLGYVGNSANTLGYDLTQTSAALAMLSDQGIQGSRAGTSLRQMFLKMANPTKTATKVLTENGLAAGQTFSIYDDNGNLKEMPDILNNISQATSHMSDTQRLAFLQQVYGTQGGEAMNAMLTSQEESLARGENAWEDYNSAISRNGSALESSEIRMKGFSGAMELLRGNLETLMIRVGKIFLPAAEAIVRAVSAVINALSNLPGPILAVISILGALTGVVLLGVGSLMVMAPAILSVYRAVQTLQKSTMVVRGLTTALRLLSMSTPLMIGLVAAVALFVAYQNNFLGFKTVVDGLARAFSDFGGVALAGIMLAVRGFGLFGATFGAFGARVSSAVAAVAKFLPIVGRFAPVISRFLGPLGIAITLFDLWRRNVFGVRDALNSLVGGVKGFFGSFMSGFNGADKAVEETTRSFNGMVETVENSADAVGGDTTAWFYTELDDNGVPQRVGQIIESTANADGKTAEVLIKTDDGEYWATIDLVTGEIVGESTVSVTADAAPARDMFQKINDGLNSLAIKANEMGLGWTLPLISGLKAVNNAAAAMWSFLSPILTSIKAQFDMYAQIENPIAAIFHAISNALLQVDFGPFQSAADVVITALYKIGDGFALLGDATHAFADVIVSLFTGDIQGALDNAAKGFGFIGEALQKFGSAAQDILGLAARGFDALAGKVPALRGSFTALAKVVRNFGKLIGAVLDVFDELFKGNFDKAIKNTGKVYKAMAKLAVSALEAIGEMASELGDILRRGVDRAVEALQRRFQSFSSSIGRVGGILNGVISTIISLGAALASLMRGDVGGFFRNLGEAAVSAVRTIGNALVLIPTFLIEAFQAIDWGQVGSMLLVGVTGALLALSSLANIAWDWFTNAVSNIDWGMIRVALMNGILAAIGYIGSLADTLIGKGWELIGGLLTGIENNWVNVALWLLGLGLRAAQAVGDLALFLLGKGLELIGGLFTGIKNRWTEIKNWVTSNITGSTISGWIGQAGTWLKEKGVAILVGLKNGIDEQWRKVETWFGEMKGKVEALISAPYLWLLNKGKQIIQGLKAGMESVWNAVESWFQGKIDWVQEKFDWLVAKAQAIADVLGITVSDEPSSVDPPPDAFQPKPGKQQPVDAPAMPDMNWNMAGQLSGMLALSAALQGYTTGLKVAHGLLLGLGMLTGVTSGLALGMKQMGDAGLLAYPVMEQIGPAAFKLYSGAYLAQQGALALGAGLLNMSTVGGGAALGFMSTATTAFASASGWRVIPSASLDAIKTKFVTVLPALAVQAQTSFSAAKTAGVSNIDSMKASVSNSVSSMSSSATNTMGAMALKLIDRASSIEKTVKTSFMNMNTAVATQTSIMNIITSAAFSTMRSNAQTSMNSMRSAVQSGMNAVVSAVRSGMNSAASAASGMSGRFYGAGADAIQGLVNGARSRLGALQSVVSQAIAIMARIPSLGNSPWPMMIGAGHDAIDGLAIGVSDRRSMLERTVGTIIDLFDVEPSLTLADATGSLSDQTSRLLGLGIQAVDRFANIIRVVADMLAGSAVMSGPAGALSVGQSIVPDWMMREALTRSGIVSRPQDISGVGSTSRTYNNYGNYTIQVNTPQTGAEFGRTFLAILERDAANVMGE